jgi:hypothetical protein
LEQAHLPVRGLPRATRSTSTPLIGTRLRNDGGMSGRCPHTDLVNFMIYADLDAGGPVQDEVATFSAGFRPEDDTVCVWVDEDRPSVLRVSYDLDIDAQANDFEAAIEAAVAELKSSLATMSFAARPISVNASTDEAQATWTEWPEGLSSADPVAVLARPKWQLRTFARSASLLPVSRRPVGVDQLAGDG